MPRSAHADRPHRRNDPSGGVGDALTARVITSVGDPLAVPGHTGSGTARA
ncbi:MAG: hypothetical protein AAGI30_13635 [Planctomycetota bacterium]